MHYIHSMTCIIYDISSTLYDVTFTLCYITQWPYLWHQTLYGYVIFTWYGIRQCYDHKTIVCLPSHYAWHNTQCIFDITHNVSIFWKDVTVCHHSLYMYDTICNTWLHIHSLWLHTIEVITLHPVHSCHCTLYIWRNTYGNTKLISAICPTVSNTTSTVSVSSNQGYPLYHTHSLYDMTNYTCDILFSMHAIRTTL